MFDKGETLNEQEMIDRGTAARELLDNPTFGAAYKTLMDIYLNTLVQTAPNDKESRESAYYQIRGIQDMVGIMNQWIIEKDNILESLKETESNSEEE